MLPSPKSGSSSLTPAQKVWDEAITNHMAQTALFVAIAVLATIGINSPGTLSMKELAGSTIGLLAIPTLIVLKECDEMDPGSSSKEELRCKKITSIFTFAILSTLVVINALQLASMNWEIDSLCLLNGLSALPFIAYHGYKTNQFGTLLKASARG